MCSTTFEALTRLRPPSDEMKAELDSNRADLDALSRGEKPEYKSSF